MTDMTNYRSYWVTAGMGTAAWIGSVVLYGHFHHVWLILIGLGCVAATWAGVLRCAGRWDW